MKRRLLLAGVLTLGGIGLGALAWVLTSSLGISPTIKESRGSEISADQLSAIVTGEPTAFSVYNTPLLILRPTAGQRASLTELDPHVWDRAWSGYDSERQLFIYWGVSTRFGCTLRHDPPAESLFLGPGVGGRWLGGFFDTCHDSSYDYAGRATKTFRYSRNGFTLEVPNLRPANHRFRADGTLVVYPMSLGS